MKKVVEKPGPPGCVVVALLLNLAASLALTGAGVLTQVVATHYGSAEALFWGKLVTGVGVVAMLLGWLLINVTFD